MIKYRCSIGVFAYNEEKNIKNVLNALLNQKLKRVLIDEIFVISSGSTDKTATFANIIAEKNKKITVIDEPERKGKSNAINTFLKTAKHELAIIVSADVVPAKDTVEKLIIPFKNAKIGMTGGRPKPYNKISDFTDFANNLLWKLHHQMSKYQPKLGEMIAFRKVFSCIPEKSAVDEASIEAIITQSGLKCMYVSDAIVYNKGPETICDFIKQRKRIAAGHLWLKDNQNYDVTSNSLGLLLGLYILECFKNPKDIVYITGTAKLEMFCRVLGYIDYKFRKINPYIWE